ncbi:MAG: Ni/Fe-hydrogenase cytochrome b subunit [Candidatus Hydrogenedentes bacterium]|nr:Ni/Fe-hydrogenase cytochrome b subunit [Candidatus Hydrogenedentota bacterium]
MAAEISYAPVQRRFFTPGVYVLLALVLTAMALAVYRFIFGLESVTNLTNQYPWGLWIGVDVATGVALAAGGFTTSALAHIFHRKRFEAVVRPALLTAMLGYTFVGLGLMLDLGRYYNIWHPAWPTMWQGNSVLFEVGMCVMAYLTVLYSEFAPIACERFIGRVNLPGRLASWNGIVDRVLRSVNGTLGRVMVLLIIAGVVLSCMHQSSLGALMLIAPYKMHALWYTPILPLLFLMSAIAVGYPMVVFESMLASRSFGRKPEMDVLTPLSAFIPIFLGIYMVTKIADLLMRDAYPLLFEGSFQSFMFLLEMGGGVILPFAMLLSSRMRRSSRMLFSASMLVVLGVLINRVNVFIVAYRPPHTQSAYIPSVAEVLITAGLIATLMLVYRVMVTLFPILPKEHPAHLPGDN